MYITWKNTKAKVYLKRNDADRYNVQISGRAMYEVSREQMEALGKLLIEAGLVEQERDLAGLIETYGHSMIELAKEVRSLKGTVEVLEQAAIERGEQE